MGKDAALKSESKTESKSQARSEVNWIRGGAAASLGAMLVLLLFRRWRLARWVGGLAAAFVEQWRENHLGANVRDLLAKSGRKA